MEDACVLNEGDTLDKREYYIYVVVFATHGTTREEATGKQTQNDSSTFLFFTFK